MPQPEPDPARRRGLAAATRGQSGPSGHLLRKVSEPRMVDTVRRLVAFGPRQYRHALEPPGGRLAGGGVP